MNKRPGHVNVTTEVAYCSFCDRVRTLRREEHQLGTLVRTIVTCETCHRTLSSTMGVAGADAPEPVEAAVAGAEPEAAASGPVKRTVSTSPKPKPVTPTAKATKARPKRTT